LNKKRKEKLQKRQKHSKKQRFGKKKSGNQNYFSRTILTFFNSFKKIRWDLLLVALYDLLLMVVVFAVGKELFLRLFSDTQNIFALKQAASLTAESILKVGIAMENFYSGIILTTAIAAMLCIFFYSIFKSLAWARVAKTKLSWKYLSRFFVMSIVWFALWTLLCVISYFILIQKAQIAVYLIVTLLLLYLTPIMNIHFLKTQKIFTSMAKAFHTGIGNIHKLILPYALFFLTGLVIYYVSGKVLIRIGVPSYISGGLFLVILLLYLAWSRIYLIDVIREIR
jgi:hypothetical protein